MCPDGAASGNESKLFPYSISGFIAEPSQSAQRPRANPAAVQSIGLRLMRGTTVCVLFCEYRRTAQCGPAQTRGAPKGVKRRCRPRVLFSALSSNTSGSRPFKPRDTGANPVRAAIFLKEAPVLDPRPESALPYRIRMKPAGGPSPAGAEFTCVRGVRATRRSASPESGVRERSSATGPPKAERAAPRAKSPSQSPRAHHWSCDVQ